MKPPGTHALLLMTRNDSSDSITALISAEGIESQWRDKLTWHWGRTPQKPSFIHSVHLVNGHCERDLGWNYLWKEN